MHPAWSHWVREVYPKMTSSHRRRRHIIARLFHQQGSSRSAQSPLFLFARSATLSIYVSNITCRLYVVTITRCILDMMAVWRQVDGDPTASWDTAQQQHNTNPQSFNRSRASGKSMHQLTAALLLMHTAMYWPGVTQNTDRPR